MSVNSAEIKSHGKQPSKRQTVIVAGGEGFHTSAMQLKTIDERKSKLTNFEFLDMSLGSRIPFRSWLMSEAANSFIVAYVLVFSIPEDQFFQMIFPLNERDVYDSINNKKNVVMVLFDHPNEDLHGQPDSIYQKVVENLRPKHRLATFDVCTKTEKGMEEAYDWLSEQISHNIAEQTTTTTSSKEKESKDMNRSINLKDEELKGNKRIQRWSFPWLAKLSKAALFFGAHSN